MWAKDGTHYTFGSQAYNPANNTGSRLFVTNSAGVREYQSYKLDKIVDTHGNQATINWQVYPWQTTDGYLQLKESYPISISYTTNDTSSPVDTHPEYMVTFQVTHRTTSSARRRSMTTASAWPKTGYILNSIRSGTGRPRVKDMSGAQVPV